MTVNRTPKASRLTARLKQRVDRFLDEYHLRKGRLVVGVSGGPDSICLLHLLTAMLKGKYPLLAAVHVDHQLRGDESSGDARYVKEFCGTLEVPLSSGSVNVQEYRRRHKLSWEEAARDMRHQVFAEVAHTLGAQVVLLAHTAADQAETVLMHLLRGAGIAGLSGMAPLSHRTVIMEPGGEARPLVIARPLLTSHRWETEAYCAEHNLHPRTDSSNLSDAFTRNRVRRHLLPEMRKFNPRVDAALVRLAGGARDMTRFLDEEAQRQWPRLVREDTGALVVDRRALNALPTALASHVLRMVLLKARGSLQGITAAHLVQVERLAGGQSGRSVLLPGGVVCVVEADRLRIGGTPPSRTAAAAGRVDLRVPGHTALPGWDIRAALLGPGEAGPEANPLRAHMDPSLASRPLWVAPWAEGDRFQPLGMSGTKKLQDFFVDAKVPRSQRGSVPIVHGEREILWVVGYRLAEAARVPAGAQQVLHLEFVAQNNVR